MGIRENTVTTNGLRIRYLRRSLGLSQEKLAFEAKLSKSTIERLEKSKPAQITTLKLLAKALGDVEVADLIDRQAEEVGDDIILNFEFLEQEFRDIDRMLLPLIRDHRHAGRKLVERAYKSLLNDQLQAKNIEIKQINNCLREAARRNFFLLNLPKPNLIVDIAENLEKISYYNHSIGKLEVKHPQLLWDCHCDTPVNKKSKFKCPIHSSKLGNEIDKRFSTGYVMICHGGISFYWRNGQELWPPSIDSLYMLDNMKSDGLFTKKYRSILDIGSGTGFLGIMAGCHNPYVTEIILSDWLLTPYLYGTINWFVNRGDREHISLKTNISLFTYGLDYLAKPCDVAICNPPYLPLLEGFDDLGLESTVAGTELLEYVILKNKSLAQKIYIQFSNLALPEAIEAGEKAGVVMKPVGQKKVVPLRLRVLWNRPEYLAVLKEKRGLIENKKSRHSFWHSVQTYVIE